MNPSPGPENLSIGVDFGGTTVKIGVCAGDHLIDRADPIPTDRHDSSGALIEAIADRVLSIRKKHPGVSAVGAGVPGFVDFDRGFVHDLTNVPTWRDVPFRDILHEETGLPSVVDNDANCMAYAEWRYGSARGFRNVVAVTLGTGIGGGLILDGKLFRGSRFGAGEIGQLSIDYRGRPGEYGNIGAAEKYVGNVQIAEHAVRKYSEAGTERTEGACTPRELAAAAEAGDPIALAVWDDVAVWLGTALSSVIWTLNPDAIVIGGGVALAGRVLFDPLERKIRAMLSPVFSDDLAILAATFGNDAGIIGAAALAADHSG